jgi:LAO/AO transport system kinase
LPDLAGRLLARERNAVPEALNLVDDQRPARREETLRLLDALERGADDGPSRIGITGAPGAGKSTLLDALVRRLRADGVTIGIVAVDPSSRVSGGALLGDRVRVRSGAGDPGVFFRSMAARERLGGLADATRASVTILSAVFDRVFVETVGVGQSEADVAALADTVVYVAQPGAGDTLQFMKAGILEHPDLFVVNKADTGPAAERTANELRAGLSMTSPAGEWKAPVLLASARDAEGITEILETLEEHRSFLVRSGELERRRTRGQEIAVRDALIARYGAYGLEQLGGDASLASRLHDAQGTSGFGLVLALGLEIEDALRKPRE